MRRLSDDRGYSLAELMVVVALMGFVIAVTYMAINFVDRSTNIARTQDAFERTVSAPLEAMDVAFSQNTLILTDTVAPAGYSVVLRMPRLYEGTTILFRTFVATSDGRLMEYVYSVDPVSGARTYRRTTTWSSDNANQRLGKPMFVYYSEGDTQTTDPRYARSVAVSVWTEQDGKQFSDTRRVYFRNR
jgi:prepilin-type N-terminal cleavage/methylation domain-containing protein